MFTTGRPVASSNFLRHACTHQRVVRMDEQTYIFRLTWPGLPSLSWSATSHVKGQVSQEARNHRSLCDTTALSSKYQI